MWRTVLLLVAGCSVSTSRFEALEPCHTDAHCPAGYRCLDGLCARCLEGASCGAADGGSRCDRAADCDDGDACNGAEVCEGGTCAPGEPLDCSAMGDPTVCVVGGCVDGVCVPQGAANGTACDDGVFCLTGDVCETGNCISGTAPACDDGDRCTIDVCDEEAGACRNSVGVEGPFGDPACADGIDNDCDGLTDEADASCITSCPEGTACDDGVFCNGPDECHSDVCVSMGPAPCTADALPCTVTCDEAVDACNVIAPTACAISGTCFAAGSVNPANPCQECAPVVSGASWTNDDSNPCVNGLFCDSLDQCVSGVCTSTGLPTCADDGLACTTTCDEGTDSCNVVDPGACLIDGVCRAGGDVDPANSCQECDSSTAQTGWTPDDTNPCSDAFSCTNDACSGGVCRSSQTGSCAGPGEVCLPQCFGGPTGCGVPPGMLSLACVSPVPVDGSTSCSLTLAGGTALAQTACLACSAEVGSTVLGHADFEECPTTLDGFAASSGAPACTTAGSNHFLQASGASWVLDRTFDTTGLDSLELCFSYAENGMDTGDTMTVSVCADGTCAAPVVLLADTAGPSSADTAWHRYCVDVDAHEPLALNNPTLLVRFSAASSTAGHLVQIDDVDLRGRTTFCVPENVAVDDDAFSCTGSACGVTGWDSTAGCDIADPCVGVGLVAGAMETLDVCRAIDLTGTIGDRFLALDVGEVGGDDANAAESFSLEVCDGAPGAGCTCATGWQQVLAHTGDLDGVATLSIRHLLADLSGLTFADPTMGVRVVAAASGPGDSVVIDRVRAGTMDYACPSAALSVGSILEVGGGSYSVDLGSSAATTAQLWCSWDTQFPPIDDRATVEFLP